MAHAIVVFFEVYAVAGAAVAAWFLLLRLDDVDAGAHGAYAFRPLLIPGLVLLWPLVLLRSAGRVTVSGRQHRRVHFRIWIVLSALVPMLLFGGRRVAAGRAG